MQNLFEDDYNKETEISFNDKCNTANVFTTSPELIKKLDDYCKIKPNDFKLQIETKLKNQMIAKNYIINKNYVNIFNFRNDI